MSLPSLTLHTLTHTHTPSLTHSLIHVHSLTHTSHKLAHSHTLTHSHTHTPLTRTLTCSHTHPLTHSPTHALTHSPPHTHTLTDTTDLQQLDVSTTPTTLDITCTLATGSDALGCNVVAVAAGNSTPFWSANLTRTGPELVLTMSFLNSELDLPSGMFSILASDLEADGTIGQLQFEEATSTRAPSELCIVPHRCLITQF